MNALAGSFYLYGLDYNTLSSVPAVATQGLRLQGSGNAAHVAIVTEAAWYGPSRL